MFATRQCTLRVLVATKRTQQRLPMCFLLPTGGRCSTRRLVSSATRKSSANQQKAGGKPKPSKTTATAWWHNEHPLMVSKTTNLTGYSVSEICGNVSFVFVCVAYLNTDILMLRVLSTGSIALSILFQYYRAIPLWIPIRWNVLLLAINSVMTVSLIAERQMANNMPGELAGTYTNGLFEARGLSKVEFVRLFSRAQKITLRKREKLAQDGQVNRRLFFVVEGAVQIQQRGKRIAKVTPYHFIGEMSFLHFLLDDECPTTSKKKCPDTMATADAVAETDTVVAYVWDFENLRDYLQGEREVRNALSAYMNYDLRAKLSLLNTTAARRRTSHKNKKL